MSLFRAREWWSAKVGEDEEFDHGSMALGNVDNDPDHRQIKVVTGSFQGMLRVHHPRQPYFRIEDLLLEQDLGMPILQVSVGQFVPAAPLMSSIAVLHPRKLAVYTVDPVGGQGSKASYFTLAKAYEHVLGGVEGGHFTAYNMTHGGFGGVSRDLLCVQSIDGRLQIFEQDAHAFTRRLNGILTPGPICYVARIDAFVVGNSEMGVDCYKYQALAASQGDREEGKSEGISRSRGLQAYWSCRLGEPAIDIFVAKFSRSLGPGNVDIVVLGERTLFTLREQGAIRLHKMLGYQPVCGCKYVVSAAPGEEGARLTGATVNETAEGFAAIVEEENLVIAGDTDHLMVYKDMQLVWQAAVCCPPVSVVVAKFGSLPGLVCSLSDDGVLSVCYQGTDPPTSAVVAPDTKEMDYDQINQEHRKLLQIIRRIQTDSAKPSVGKLTLQVQVPRVLDHNVATHGRTTTRRRTRNEEPDASGLADDDDGGGGDDEHSFSKVKRQLTSETSFNDTSGSVLRQPLPLVDNGDASDCSGDNAHRETVAVTARFVVTYSGAGELRDATLNVTPPPEFTAFPSVVLLPPIRGTGSGSSGHDLSGRRSPVDPCVVSMVFRAQCGTGRVPSSLLGHASVMYSRQALSVGGGRGDGVTGDSRIVDGDDGDGLGKEPMSARCEVSLPLVMAARAVATRRDFNGGCDNNNNGTSCGDGGNGAVKNKRNAMHKFTFITNEEPVSPSSLFEDMLPSQQQHGSNTPGDAFIAGSGGGWVSNRGGGAGGGPAFVSISGKESDGRNITIDHGGEGFDIENNAITSKSSTSSISLSFRFWTDKSIDRHTGEGSQDVTVAVSKNSGNYRVQSGSFVALGVIATELVRRLREYFGEGYGKGGSHRRDTSRMREGKTKPGEADTRLRIDYTDTLPLSEVYGFIDQHFEGRKYLKRAEEQLNAAAHQYRVVEKRLLARFKDRNPAPLSRLDVVSEETYLRLVDLVDEVQRAQEQLTASAGELGSALRLLAQLMQCRFQLGRRDYALLLAHLHPNVADTDDQGWEETVDAAMTHLLRTVLAKVAKDSVPIPPSGQAPLLMPQDTSKLKKHISIVCDRLNRGARLAVRASSSSAAPPSSPSRRTSPSISPPSSLSQHRHNGGTSRK